MECEERGRVCSFVMLGAGNLATNLCFALKRRGFQCKQVYSRTEKSAWELSEKLGCDHTICLNDLKKDADVYFISIKDDGLESLIAQIPFSLKKSLFVHTAGSMPMNLFKGKVDRYGVFYPMQTFSKQRIIDFNHVPIFIEGCNSEVSQKLRMLGECLSEDVFELSSEERRYLHLAAVFACNFTNHCYVMAEQILSKIHVPFGSLLPLIDETVKKVHSISPKEAQTGPAVRNDKNVMEQQLRLIEENEALKEFYKLASNGIHETALQAQNDKKND